MLISTGGFDLVPVNSYQKSDIWETQTLTDYLENLNKMENILRDFSFDSIFFIGDFNADPFLGRSWHNLKNFMQCNSLKCYDVDQLPDDTFTFISYGESHCKWLDHIIGKNSSHVRVKDIKVYSDLTGSDHFPIAACFEVKNAPQNISKSRSSLNRGNISYFVNWEKLNEEELKAVDDVTLSVMGSFRNNIAVLCSHIGCTDEQHIIEIYNMYC